MTTTPTPPAEVDVAEGRRLLKSLHLPWGSSVRNTSTIGPRPSAGEFHHAAVVKDGDTAYAMVELLNMLPALFTAAEQVAGLREENERLREYFNAREALRAVGLMNASDEMFAREDRARSALGAAP